MEIKVYHIVEHERRVLVKPDSEEPRLLSDDQSDIEHIRQILLDPEYNPEKSKKILGIDWDDSDRTRNTIRANYFVGVQWLQEKKSAIMVTPKIANIDFMTMFLKCYDSSVAKLRQKLPNIYSIDLDAPPISCKSVDFDITPLIIAHFVKSVEAITAKGLKKDYMMKEEALHGKIKGKLLLGRQFNRYLNTGRCDILDCRYQDYSADNIYNRILKKGLLFAQSYFNHHLSLSSSVTERNIIGMIAAQLAYFKDVGSELSIQEIKHHRINPLFHEYEEALKLAKRLLCRFGYSISNTDREIDKHSTPPFWIDMPILFELYAYVQLYEKYGTQIDYHISTSGNEIDFVKYDEQVIIDTKYIPVWDEKTIHENVRQLSGYARNKSIRRKIMNHYDESTILPCLILYPDSEGKRAAALSDNSILEGSLSVREYVKVYKRDITLPFITP